MIESMPLRTGNRLVISPDSHYWNLWNLLTLLQTMGLIRLVPDLRMIRDAATIFLQREWERTDE
jgi:hypothetical protein